MKNQLGEIQITQRAFEYVEFTDLYGLKCSLQQSSIALTEQPGAGAVWLGIKNARMHLDVDGVRNLVDVLEHWLDTGCFTGEDIQ